MVLSPKPGVVRTPSDMTLKALVGREVQFEVVRDPSKRVVSSTLQQSPWEGLTLPKWPPPYPDGWVGSPQRDQS